MAEALELNLATLKTGDQLPALIKEPISRAALALFAGASNDHNPVHIDSDAARSAGMDDVFAHGMLSMAYLGQLLTNWVPQSRLMRWSVRFAAITPIHSAVIATGEVVAIFDDDARRTAEIKIVTATEAGVITLMGQAFVYIG